ncbi:hypothetical protein [Sphingopyxis sp.]|uniref:hypothetical protein n=1 Tax=Sphingopyxis sp. TaxID=1908224 RepID=UPI002B46A191|nr:hypothetical protein [Sphingopyxis sp.]
MNGNFGPELERFRAEVGAFLDAAPTDAFRAASQKTTGVFAPVEDAMARHRILPGDIIMQSIWRMTPRHGRARIDCPCREYFGIDQDPIVRARRFYRAVEAMAAASGRARAAGVDLDLPARRA